MLKKVLLTCATVLAMAMPIAAQEDDRFIENAEIDTFIGILTFEKGFPTGDTAETLFRFRTLYRTAEVIQQNAFAASLAAMRHGYEEFGAGEPHQVIVWKNLMDAESGGCVETRSALSIAVDLCFLSVLRQRWRFVLLNRFYGGLAVSRHTSADLVSISG